ncbi:MAG: signal peptidase I [Parcubacteria group bacterium Gr01-1014_70]|nr:MAG: signal peptidase I [Parcubacteria group bacterium Gr01-1014_70]
MDENNKSIGFFGRFFREVWEFAKIVLVSLAIVLPIRFFVAQPFIVRGASMEPTFQDGEYLIIDELSYFFRPPERGEVIVFRYPADPSQFFIKRIVGLPGETVIIENGSVAVQNESNPNGFLLNESYLPPSLETVPNVRKTLQTGEYFVLGDNRRESSDSRVWGVLAERFLVGRTLLRLWPFTELGLVTSL